MFLKGRLFYPLTESWYDSSPESIKLANLHPSHLRGWWSRYPYQPAYRPHPNPKEQSDPTQKPIEDTPSVPLSSVDPLLLERNPNPIKQQKLQYSRWVFVNRSDFLSPMMLTAVHEYDILDYDSLKQRIVSHFHQYQKRAALFAEIVPFEMSQYKGQQNPTGIIWVEVSRGFIVGSFWPYHSQGNQHKVVEKLDKDDQ
eukprot:TRINITY_DN15037_c0_g1_i1.p1 TRINITY_DN15037_c0_g1~~TRINITY_DN15037_c0_g1_i1.p1  ORF type:complete len:198 (-),score=31.81 TRINITY_DN15037_c0_g1_i1:53-646(-)